MAHSCKHCGKVEGEVAFNRNGNRLFFICKGCNREYRKRFNRNPELMKACQLRREKKVQDERASGVNRDKYILWDSRKWDRLHGMENDLTREFIRDLISGPCSYCGTTRLKMTLDRIDNSLGHLKSNVVGSCSRCNFIRRDMPHAAWMVLSKTIREIESLGLFGDWTGEIQKYGSRTDDVGTEDREG